MRGFCRYLYTFSLFVLRVSCGHLSGGTKVDPGAAIDCGAMSMTATSAAAESKEMEMGYSHHRGHGGWAGGEKGYFMGGNGLVRVIKISSN